MHRHFTRCAMVAVAIFGIVSPSARAARLLEFIIEVNGKPVLVGITDDSGRAGVAEMWNYLHRVKFEPPEGKLIDVQMDDPTRAVLRGPLSIRIEQGRSSLGQVQVNDLALIRDEAAKNVWRLPEEEIVRVTNAAGVPYAPPNPSKRSDSLMWIMILVVAAVIVTAVGVWLWRKADAPSGNP